MSISNIRLKIRSNSLVVNEVGCCEGWIVQESFLVVVLRFVETKIIIIVIIM